MMTGNEWAPKDEQNLQEIFWGAGEKKKKESYIARKYK